jgi:heptosyltransferase-1
LTGATNSNCKRVLIIRLGRLGDTIMATPIIELVRQVFGESVVIDFAASPGASSRILQLDQRIQDVISITHRKLPWPIHAEKRKLRNRSRSKPYDLVVNLECGSECDDFYEFIKTKEFLGRPLIQPQHGGSQHCVDTEKSIYAQRMGSEVTAATDPSLDIPLDPDYKPLFENSDYVVLNPSFFEILKKDYRANRGWPLEHWAELIGLIRQRSSLAVAINGTKEDHHIFEPLLALPGVKSLLGSSLQQLTDVLSGARYAISVDTGTMHLSAALGIPTIALFGPTIPGLTGPYSKNTPVEVLTSGISCQPCHRTSTEKSCGFARCMQDLKPEDVFRAIEALLL